MLFDQVLISATGILFPGVSEKQKASFEKLTSISNFWDTCKGCMSFQVYILHMDNWYN